MAALTRKAAKVFIITNYEDPEVSSMVSILDTWMWDNHFLKWGCNHIHISGIDDAKRKIARRLRRGDYIW